MGATSSKKTLKQSSRKKRSCFRCCCCCCCSPQDSSYSYSSSSCSIDEKYLPTFDRLTSSSHSNGKNPIINHAPHLSNRQASRLERKTVAAHFQSIENLEKSLHSTTIIDQWIDSLPILGTPSLNRTTTTPIDDHLSDTQEQYSDNPSLTRILSIKANRSFVNLVRKCHLNFYLKDFCTRLNATRSTLTFKEHFSCSAIIHPNPGHHQLSSTLTVTLVVPAESIVPCLSNHSNSLYLIHEQTRFKCYFIPSISFQIEPSDAYEQSNHIDDQSSRFVSTDGFRKGFIRVDPQTINKDFHSFIQYSSEENQSFLSSRLIRQWFQTLMLINQTCAIAKRFLTGDGSHITCLVKDSKNLLDNFNLTFAAFRLPICTYLTDPSLNSHADERSDSNNDAFSPLFLSDRPAGSSNTILLDYEHYSFAFLLHRWPQQCIDHYFTHPSRSCQRQWPNKSQMNQLLSKPLLLVPSADSDQWEVRFDLIEQTLLEWCDDSSRVFYALCQQIFARTWSTRQLIKHCFFNYCERHGLPCAKPRDQLNDLFEHFLDEITRQIDNQFIPNYFNHQLNLFDINEDYYQWLETVRGLIHHRSSLSPSSFIITSKRSMIIEFLFHFIDQLYQSFHRQRSQFHLNDQVLLDLHHQLCDILSNDPNNNLISSLFNHDASIERIQQHLSSEFEANAELVHTCLNQIRKAQPSLIFHYTWTIFIQYLHTYYNVLWNI